MGMIRCPECNAKISDHAHMCPRCGFSGANANLPISHQVEAETLPDFRYETEHGTVPEKLLAKAVIFNDRQVIAQTFGNWNWVEAHLPGIADAIQQCAHADGQLVADITPYMRRMIAKGQYRFNIDSAGKLLPTIRDSSGRIVKQVRLKRYVLSQAGLTNLCSSMASHMEMVQLMERMEYLCVEIQNIHLELQTDRLAKAESAKELFLSAQCMTDPALREQALLNAVQVASEAKYALMRNCENNMHFVQEASNKSIIQMAIDSARQQSVPTRAKDAFNDLAAATLACQIECFSYLSLGEKKSASSCISRFTDFLAENHLNDPDTLTLLHENINSKNVDILHSYRELISSMISFQSGYLQEGNETPRIEKGD